MMLFPNRVLMYLCELLQQNESQLPTATGELQTSKTSARQTYADDVQAEVHGFPRENASKPRDASAMCHEANVQSIYPSMMPGPTWRVDIENCAKN